LIEFWIDTDCLIQARNGPYGFDIAPGFWSVLDDNIANGRIGTSRYVYQEIMAGKQDDIMTWLKQHRHTTMFTEPTREVQNVLGQIANHVSDHPLYQRRWKDSFLSKADPWIISHAVAMGGRVVTFEALAGDNTTKVKIPNICNQFDVEAIKLFDMLRSLGTQLS